VTDEIWFINSFGYYYHIIFACVEFKVSVDIEEEYILLILLMNYF